MLLYLPHKANDSEVSFFFDWLLKKKAGLVSFKTVLKHSNVLVGIWPESHRLCFNYKYELGLEPDREMDSFYHSDDVLLLLFIDLSSYFLFLNFDWTGLKKTLPKLNIYKLKLTVNLIPRALNINR